MAKKSTPVIQPPAIAPAGHAQANQPRPPLVSPISPSYSTLTSNGATSTPTSLTSKEWVVPPRPKPGRKAAIDIPPTKRKAQNREAQRAFRERKAARIGELEEQLQSIEQQNKEEQNALRKEVTRLEKVLEETRISLDFWRERCNNLEAGHGHENDTTNDAYPSSDAVLASRHPPSNSTRNQPSDAMRQAAVEPLGCGQCSSISDCRCIQEIINMPDPHQAPAEVDSSSNKRPSSPGNKHSTVKRVKAQQPYELETDFTAVFSRQLHDPSSGNNRTSPSSTITDPCGFCRDGTACICADMQAAEAIGSIANNHGGAVTTENHNSSQPTPAQPSSTTTRIPTSTLPRISELSHMTPPPSESDVSLPTFPPAPATTTPRPSGPGTCLQCQTDPNSTLFCKLLAKSRRSQQVPQQQQCTNSSLSSPQTGLCCGGKSCRTSTPQQQQKSASAFTISCADAYTTLSRHPGFGRAMDSAQEMLEWVPQLWPVAVAVDDEHNAAGEAVGEEGEEGLVRRKRRTGEIKEEVGRDSAGVVNEREGQERGRDTWGRPALEMDAAQVMATLKLWDRRYT